MQEGDGSVTMWIHAGPSLNSLSVWRNNPKSGKEGAGWNKSWHIPSWPCWHGAIYPGKDEEQELRALQTQLGDAAPRVPTCRGLGDAVWALPQPWRGSKPPKILPSGTTGTPFTPS